MDTPLIARLHAVRRRHTAVTAGRAAVVVVLAAVACLGVGMLADRWFNLPYAVRIGLAGVYGVVLGVLALRRGLLPIVRGPDVEQAALWVERAVPAFASRLISAVQFAQPAGIDAHASAAMARAVVRQAEEAAVGVDFTAVVPVRDLRRSAITGAGIIAAFAVLFALGGRTSVALAARALLVPGVPFPHRTRVAVATGDVTVAKGDAITLSATATGVVPAEGRVTVRYPDGTTASLPATAAAGRFDRAIDNVQEPFTYRFAIGDDESAEYHVRTAPRPAVSAIRCLVSTPAYTGLKPRERSPWDLTMPVGSKLGLFVTPNTPCTGTVHFLGVKSEVPLGRGLVLFMPETDVPVTATGFTIELVSGEGLRSRDPVVYKIEQTVDHPPTVRLTAPAADATVTPVACPAIGIEADDDYGVARLALRYRITRAGQSIAVDDDPNGLTGIYSPGDVARVDPTVDFSWGAAQPPAGVDGARPFTVRWVGSVRPAMTDSYVFEGRSGCDVTVAGQSATRAPVRLQAGRLYPITVTSAVQAGGASRLVWRGRRVPTQVVPHACLYRRTTPYEPPPDADGLIGYWPMDDAEPGYARDAVGSADGVVYDAERVPGKIGGAILFGVHPTDVDTRHSRRVEVPESPAMQFKADDSYTLTAWVAVGPVTKHWQAVVAQGRGGGRWTGIGIGPGGHLVAGSPGGDLIGPIPSAGWHHVAVVQDGAHRTLYVDGMPAVTGPARDITGGPLSMGNLVDASQPFVGGIDDVRLYARAVPADQVQRMALKPQAVRLPTPSEIGGLPGGSAATVVVDLPGRPSPHVARQLNWDLTKLATKPSIGDTIDLWVDAADGNAPPGVASSEHRTLRIVNESEKRQELLGRLGDYLGQVKDVSDDQRQLADHVGTMLGPTTRGTGGN